MNLLFRPQHHPLTLPPALFSGEKLVQLVSGKHSLQNMTQKSNNCSVK
jgi:hypothetical protein